MQSPKEISQAKRARRAAEHPTHLRINDKGAGVAIKAMLHQQGDLLRSRRAASRAPIGVVVRDISRDASRRGLIHNTPVKVNAGSYTHNSAPQTLVF